MLTVKEEKYIENNASIYDHDYRFWTEILGEPFLINDCLVYYDGRIIHICSFKLSDPFSHFTIEDFYGIIDNFDLEKTQGIRLWGNISFSASIINLNKFELVEWQDYSSKDFDNAIVLDSFSYHSNKKARLARNNANNKGYNSIIKKHLYLTSSHISIIENWVNNHKIIPSAASVIISIQGILKYENVYLVNTFLRDEFVGFALFSIINKYAILLQMLSKYIPNGRVGDSIMDRLISFCKEENITRLHLGYSANSSILRFKKKWGANWNGPGYVYFSLAKNKQIRKYFEIGRYFWKERIL